MNSRVYSTIKTIAGVLGMLLQVLDVFLPKRRKDETEVKK